MVQTVCVCCRRLSECVYVCVCILFEETKKVSACLDTGDMCELKLRFG